MVAAEPFSCADDMVAQVTAVQRGTIELGHVGLGWATPCGCSGTGQDLGGHMWWLRQGQCHSLVCLEESNTNT